MNTQIRTIAAMTDTVAIIQQCIEHMSRQDWRETHAAQASRIPAIRECSGKMIIEFCWMLEYLGNAGLDYEGEDRGCMLAALQDSYDDRFHGAHEEMLELAAHRDPIGDDLADRVHQAKMEAAE